MTTNTGGVPAIAYVSVCTELRDLQAAGWFPNFLTSYFEGKTMAEDAAKRCGLAVTIVASTFMYGTSCSRRVDVHIALYTYTHTPTILSTTDTNNTTKNNNTNTKCIITTNTTSFCFVFLVPHLSIICVIERRRGVPL